MTDDRKARRIAAELGVPLLSTPEVMKQWAVVVAPAEEELKRVLEAVERFANYRPGRKAIDYDWWVAAMGEGKEQ